MLGAGLDTAQRRTMWAFHFTSCMDNLGVAWQGPDGEPVAVDLSALRQALAASWEQAEWGEADAAKQAEWATSPAAVRAAPEAFSRGFQGFVYRQWFQADEWVRKETWMYHLTQPRHIRVVAQFRTGAHWLAVRTGRWSRTARSERVCPHCKDQVEDELHLWECPLYAGLRTQHARIGVGPGAGGWTDEKFRARMHVSSREDWLDLAEFLIGCKELRESALASAPRERT